MTNLFYNVIDFGNTVTKFIRVNVLNEKIHICNTIEEPSRGIKDGIVYDTDEFKSLVKIMFEKLFKIIFELS